jgi:hypothetical protein
MTKKEKGGMTDKKDELTACHFERSEKSFFPERYRRIQSCVKRTGFP